MKNQIMQRPNFRKKSRAQAGFTLLEMLVVTVLLGLLFLMLSGGVTFGLRGWARQHAEQDRLTDRSETDASLRKLLGSVTSDAGGVTGAEDRLALTTLMRLADGKEHEVNIGLGVDRKQQLILRWQRYSRPGCAPEGKSTEEVLAKSISALHVRYWGGSPAEWHTTWGGNTPLLFGVRVIPVHGAPWTEIIIKPLRADGAADGP
ncbi:prepilin-type N-terminal cleavage/methylation domain-containing protein [Acetobacter indonesiensis]|uniref:prepilin-type N-terminal cleavage/methylation domain-containing protein n=1 Tax=Acetobacter indonesiensis TaxID=104101 RepID=UPI0039EBA317